MTTAPTAQSHATDSALVERVLARYHALTMDALLSDIPRQSPPYLYDLAGEYPNRGGKGLRAALCLAVCRAFGGETSMALHIAVAVELFHNAFLIHDDIQDGSELRRNSPTLSARYGVGVALNVGNVTNLLGLQRMMATRHALGGEVAWQLFEETELMFRHSLEGQALEVGWIRDNVCELTADDYYRMCLKKTSWYTFLYPCRAGLLATCGKPSDAVELDQFGWYLGAAFQIRDDVLNLIADERYGKERAGDLWEGKRTLMLIHLLGRCSPAERSRIRRFLSRTRTERTADGEGEVHWLLERMTAYECVDSAQSAAEQLAEAAEREIARVLETAPAAESDDGPVHEEDRVFLRELPRFIVSRGH